MTSSLSDNVIDLIGHARSLYHRLVLVVGGAGTGKTRALRDVTAHTGAPLVNVSLELARRLLDLTERQRTLRAKGLLDCIVAKPGSEIVLLDNTEVLFDVALQLDPLRLLQGVSRSRTVVATWNGSIEDDHLHYAVPGHPEHRSYLAGSLLVVHAETTH